MLFQAVMKFLCRLVEIKILVIRGKVNYKYGIFLHTGQGQKLLDCDGNRKIMFYLVQKVVFNHEKRDVFLV